MLVLCSNGLSSEKLVSAVSEKIHGCKTAALVVTADNKVLIGWSAAAFVFGPTLELVNGYSPEMNFFGLTDIKGIELTKVEVLPHYSKFKKRLDRFEERCSDCEEAHGIEVIRINDGEGVLIDNKGISICRL